jgi:hypothetical protein
MQGAYTDAANRVNLDVSRLNVGGGDIGGMTLTPGVYTFTTAILITADIVLEGGVDDVFIFQCTAVLSQSVNTKVILSGGVQAKNVIWQNAGNVKIQAGAFMQVFCVCQTLLLRLPEWCYHGTDCCCPSEGDCHSDWDVSSTGRCRVPVAPITADKVPASPVDIATAATTLSCPRSFHRCHSTITGNMVYHQQLIPLLALD